MRRRSSGWPTEAAAIFIKDLRVELRTRYALTAILLFAVICLTAISFSVQDQGGWQLQSALLWLVLLFSSLTGLMRAFVVEEDARTADMLRLSASPLAVFVGKLAFNALLLAVLVLVLVPGFCLFMHSTFQDVPLLLVTLLVGCWGLSTVLTFTAALVSRARAQGALGTVLAFPLLAPLLKMAIGAGAAALSGSAEGWVYIRALVSFSGIMTVAAVLLFESIWNP